MTLRHRLIVALCALAFTVAMLLIDSVVAGIVQCGVAPSEGCPK